MSLIVIIEILTMYIILMYLNEIDGYAVMVLIGVRICIIIRSANGWISLMMLVIIWPIFYGYIEWISIWIAGVKIGEFHKKIVVIIMVMSLVIISVELLYVIVLSIGVYRISSVIALRVYGWLILGVGMTLLLLVYLLGNTMIELNWKVLVMGVLPLPVFFIKVIMGWMLLYVVIYFGILVIVNSNGN